MPIQVQCPNCATPATLPDNAAGKNIRCRCGASFPAIANAVYNGMVIEDVAPPSVPPRQTSITTATIRCDSCHASLNAGSTKCEYCGQQSVILIQGTRLSDLLLMYLDAEQFQEAQDVTSDILKEHPQNALAWAAKGLSALHLKPRLSIDDEIKAAIKCCDTARRLAPEGELVADLRGRAALKCLEQAQRWERQWESDFRANQGYALFGNTKETFALVHIWALAAEQFDARTRPAVITLLTPLDDIMEQTFNWLWVADGYQARRQKKAKTMPWYVWILPLFGAASVYGLLIGAARDFLSVFFAIFWIGMGTFAVISILGRVGQRKHGS